MSQTPGTDPLGALRTAMTLSFNGLGSLPGHRLDLRHRRRLGRTRAAEFHEDANPTGVVKLCPRGAGTGPGPLEMGPGRAVPAHHLPGLAGYRLISCRASPITYWSRYRYEYVMHRWRWCDPQPLEPPGPAAAHMSL
jgi:hypothetical protein